jgi:hypothetical protein
LWWREIMETLKAVIVFALLIGLLMFVVKKPPQKIMHRQLMPDKAFYDGQFFDCTTFDWESRVLSCGTGNQIIKIYW